MLDNNKNSALSIIFKAADEYEKNLRDNNLMFVCQDKHKRISFFEVEFNASNFLHLTGVKISSHFKKNLNSNNEFANKFYEKCLKRRLSVKDFYFAVDGTTQLKLDVLPALMKKNLSANSIGDLDAYTFKLYTEKIAGSTKGCMGFVTDQEVNKNIPNTVLKTDPRYLSKTPLRIIVTYRKKKSDTQYSEIVYLAKGILWKDIKFPSEISNLPKPSC